jgi:hypothetical protein
MQTSVCEFCKQVPSNGYVYILSKFINHCSDCVLATSVYKDEIICIQCNQKLRINKFENAKVKYNMMQDNICGPCMESFREKKYCPFHKKSYNNEEKHQLAQNNICYDCQAVDQENDKTKKLNEIVEQQLQKAEFSCLHNEITELRKKIEDLTLSGSARQEQDGKLIINAEVVNIYNVSK